MSIASNDSGQEVYVRPPAHPVPTLQGPFEESMVESVDTAADFEIPIDAVSRRTILLEGPTYERIIAGRWKQKPGENYHPIWKLVAQMTFGLHLLARNLAKSEDEVMKILQNHVDDIDHVLERTAEDFDLAHSDMYERLRCLKLPLQHGEVFDRMLEDRTFRASILDGNEKIEHIVSRTRRALKDSMKDVQKGFDATNVLDTYLSGLSKTWQRESPEHEAVFVAMLGNVEGWKRAFMDLHLQGNKVGGTLKKLMEIVSEMEKRAALASRHQLAMSQASMATITQTSSDARNSAKPLPVAPGHRVSTRGSSRSTNALRDFSSPYSNGSQEQSSAGSGQSGPYTGRQTPMNAMSEVNDGLKDATSDTSQLAQQMLTARQSDFDGVPVELPADVPEDALRLAPVSKNNRLSYTLGLKPKDVNEHRISSIYYPQALSNLLKIQQSPPVVKSPQISAIKQESPHSSTGDYFSAHIRGSSITLVPVNASKANSNITTPEKMTPSSAERSPVIVEVQDMDNAARASVMSSPGLNSHPSVMSMAIAPPAPTPPVELPAANENQRRSSFARQRESRSSIGLLSSLGEPGPEIANSEYSGEDANVPDLPTFKIDEPDSAKRTKFISGIDLPETVVTALAKTETPSAPTTPLDPPPHRPDVETSGDKPTMSEHGGDSEGPTAQAKPPATVQNEQVVVKVDEAEQKALLDCETPTQKAFVAELEADVPVESTHSTPVQRTRSPIPALVEMEAPAAHFVLPSRASATAITVAPPPTVKQRTNLLKARAAALEKEQEKQKEQAPKPKDVKQMAATANKDELNGPLKLRLAKRDGKMVAVDADSPGVELERTGVKAGRFSADVIATLIDQISDTPATSPKIEQTPTQSSPLTANKRFGRPESAPVPPSPGGRAMATSDYASAGALEGERKSKPKSAKRHSAGKVSTSMSGLKDLIAKTTTRRHSTEIVDKSNQHSIASQADGSKLLDTNTGVDVLWFKGHATKDKANIPVGVS